MAIRRVGIAPLISAGFQRIALNTTATSLNSTIRGNAPVVLDMSVEAQNVRFTADGTTPTANTGILLTAASGRYRLEGYNGTSLLKFARVASGAILNVQAWKYSL